MYHLTYAYLCIMNGFYGNESDSCELEMIDKEAFLFECTIGVTLQDLGNSQ